MALWLRPTALAPPAHADRPDYLVIEDGETIGRIYDEGQYVPADIRWFWSITVGSQRTRAGHVATLEEAKAQFQKSWDAWKVWARLEERG